MAVIDPVVEKSIISVICLIKFNFSNLKVPTLLSLWNEICTQKKKTGRLTLFAMLFLDGF